VDDKLSFYRQQYNSVAKKKNEKESSLKDLLSEKRVLDKELETKLEQLEEAHPGRVKFLPCPFSYSHYRCFVVRLWINMSKI
jgi:peroxiredoxin family protein